MSSGTTEPMKLSRLLSATAPNKVFIAILLGILAGLAYALIIPLVLTSLEETDLAHQLEHIYNTAEETQDSHFHLFGIFDVSKPKLALTFFLVCLFILFCRTVSQSLLSRTAIDATVDLRTKLYRRISSLPTRDMEKIGPSRIVTALNNDIDQVIRGASVFPGLISSLATVVGLLGFLIYLDVHIFFFIICMILFGAITYRIPIVFAQGFLQTARKYFDNIQEGIRGLIYGAKELKLNQQRRQNFLAEDLYAIEEKYRSFRKRGLTLLVFALTYGDLISFATIGVVTYTMVNYYQISQQSLIGIIMVLIYITAPIAVLLNAASPIIQASVAMGKLQTLIDEMPVEDLSESQGVIDFHSLYLNQVTFKYDDTDEFQVGPIELTLRRGEVVFLIGGNGSGKTTLAKLLSLHYAPLEGSIYFDEQIVTDGNRNRFRQCISAIYSDFHLFTKLFGIDHEELDQLADRYLSELELDEIVVVKDGRFSSTALSDGQKKRLALLVAYLDDRSIYIFDEWAADQDPNFKEIFYNQILPGLRKKGKLIVVLSHDDRYFHLADKIVKMENGKILNGDEIKGNAKKYAQTL